MSVDHSINQLVEVVRQGREEWGREEREGRREGGRRKEERREGKEAKWSMKKMLIVVVCGYILAERHRGGRLPL